MSKVLAFCFEMAEKPKFQKYDRKVPKISKFQTETFEEFAKLSSKLPEEIEHQPKRKTIKNVLTEIIYQHSGQQGASQASQGMPISRRYNEA